MKFLEKFNRTVLKVISWRIVITISNVVVTYIVTGDWTAGFAVAGIMTLINTIIYTAHERAWNRVQWGKNIAE